MADSTWGVVAIRDLPLEKRIAFDGQSVSVVVQFAVLCHLFSHARSFAPSLSSISKRLSIDIKTTRRCIEVLRSCGYVTNDELLNVIVAPVEGGNDSHHSTQQGLGMIPTPGNDSHSTLGMIPTPPGNDSHPKSKREKKKNTSSAPLLVDTELESWIERWNDWADARLVAARVTSRNQELLAAWQTFKKTPDIQELLADTAEVDLAIRTSFVVGQVANGGGGWFTLPRLLANKKTGTGYVAAKLMSGDYRDPVAAEARRKADEAAAAEAEQRRRNAEILNHRPVVDREQMLRLASKLIPKESVA